MRHFGIFNELINVVHCVHNIEWDFFWAFQTPCVRPDCIKNPKENANWHAIEIYFLQGDDITKNDAGNTSTVIDN